MASGDAARLSLVGEVDRRRLRALAVAGGAPLAAFADLAQHSHAVEVVRAAPSGRYFRGKIRRQWSGRGLGNEQNPLSRSSSHVGVWFPLVAFCDVSLEVVRHSFELLSICCQGRRCGTRDATRVHGDRLRKRSEDGAQEA